MNKFLILLINLAIIATPICAIYFYFKLTVPQVKVKKSEVSAIDYEKEVNGKLFPNYEALVKSFEEPKAVEEKRSDLSSILQKYILIGINWGNKENSKAIIKNTTTNKQLILRIGEVLEGATLVDINFEQKFVIFEKDKEQFKIELTKLKPGTRVASVSRDGLVGAQSADESSKNPVVAKRAAWENKKPEEVIKIEKDQYTENLYYTDRTSVEYIKENLYKLAGEMYVKPVFTDSGDRLLGLRVEQIKNASIFTKVGLKPSDVITKVNDVELSSIPGITKLFYSKELYDMKDVRFYILRDGKEQKIQVKVKD